MGMSIGIVGLPNIGKSTTFNALTHARNAEAANYPFCTINANTAIVPVPDERLVKLAEITKPKEVIPTTVAFTDIAGLVKGASRGEGLGNQFLANIREADAILHLVRCFENENVIHLDGSVDPLRDIAVINTELILADLQSLERRIERLEKQIRQDKKLQSHLNLAQDLLAHLDAGQPAASFPSRTSEDYRELNRDLRFLSGKPMIYGANLDEQGLIEGSPHLDAVREHAASQETAAIALCAKIEEELIEMADGERLEYLATLGVESSGLDQIIQIGYRTLGLVSFFTTGPKQARAWTIRSGWKAPQAAAVIHEDFERGFIRAEVIAYDDYLAYQGEAGARAAGVLRTEGKEYLVKDGDVIHFLFNV